MNKVWLVIQYDYENSDIISICTNRTRAYELRKEYLKNWKSYNNIVKPHAKSVAVVEYDLNELGGSIYG